MAPIRRAWWMPVVVALAVVGVALTTLAWLGDAVRERNGVTVRDPGVLDAFVDGRARWLVSGARVLTDLASPPVVLVVALCAGWLLWRRGAPLVWSLAPAGSVALAAVAATIGKHVFDRARPPVAWQVVAEHEPSFPSGHTSDGTALYLAIALVVAVVFVQRRGARVGVVATAVAVSCLIGLSRLELGVHWPTDVLAGWAVGIAAVALSAAAATLVTGLDPATLGRVPVAEPAVRILRRCRKRPERDLR